MLAPDPRSVALGGLGAAVLFDSDTDADEDVEPNYGKKFAPLDAVFFVDPASKDQLGLLLACAPAASK